MIAETQVGIRNNFLLYPKPTSHGGAPILGAHVANSNTEIWYDPHRHTPYNISKLLLLMISLVFSPYTASADTVIGTNITMGTTGAINIGSGVITSDYIQLNYMKALFGFKDRNTTVWQLKINYSADLAETILSEQETVALALIESAKNESLTHKGESITTKKKE